MSDIRKLKNQLADLFQETTQHVSDVDIFAEPEPYEYALSESVNSHEDCEFVDVEAVHAESFREYLLANPHLTENKSAKVRIDAKSAIPKKDQPVHKSGTPEEIKKNLEKLRKQFDVELVDDFEQYTSNAPKTTDKEESLLTKSIRESSHIRFGDIATIKTNFQDADFWIVRRGSEETVGQPTKEFSPEHIGVKIERTDLLLPDYMYYVIMNFHQRGVFKQLARGTARLVNIKSEDIKNIPLEIQDPLNEARGDIRKGIAAIAILASLWGVNHQLAKQAYESSPQLQKLTAYLEVAKEHDDKRMIDQLKTRIQNHKARLKLGKGDVMGPGGQPIDVVYDKDVKETNKITADEDPCWPGYTMRGTKTKDGKEVPNCVPGEKG